MYDNYNGYNFIQGNKEDSEIIRQSKSMQSGC